MKMVISPRLLLLTGVIICACRPDHPVNMSTFEIHEDFNIELVAMEPLITDPVDMEFDEFGNAYVIEMPSYPDFPEQNRIVILQDTDYDGVFDQRTLFADSLGVSSSLLPFRGGFLVAAPPHLLYLKDTNGDHRADLREVIMSGFSDGNTQHNFNGLTYGIDNWIYIANGGNSGEVYWAGDSLNKIPLRGQDFRIDIENKKFELIGDSSGGFELAMDAWGNLFETHNLEHISHLEFNEQYLNGIQLLGKSARGNISDHDVDGLARIYPIGLQETRVNHPEQSGYFSGACGITYYGGDLWPDNDAGSVLVADVVLNLIHRDIISANGSSFLASRDQQDQEFLASSDRSFRPVNMTVGPDGSLFVLDMHREVIEHPEWIPDELETGLDLNAGRDQGRIYRITPKVFKSLNPTATGTKDPAFLIKQLEHPNQWHRITAQRLLVERHDINLQAELEQLFLSSHSIVAQLHALHTLEGLGVLSSDILKLALDHREAEIQRHAVVLAEARTDDQELWNKILKLTSDTDSRVRRQLALSLSRHLKLAVDDKVAALMALLNASNSDHFTLLAVLASAPGTSAAFLHELLQSATTPMIPPEWYADLAALAVHDSAVNVSTVLAGLSSGRHADSVVTAILYGLSETNRDFQFTATRKLQISNALDKLENEKFTKIQACWKLRKRLGLETSTNYQLIIDRALAVLHDEQVNPAQRIQAFRLIADQDLPELPKLLMSLLDISQPQDLQLAAAEKLAEISSDDLADELIARWNQYGPQIRVQVSDILIYQSQHHPKLLSALENGQLSMGELNLHLERRRELLFADDPQVRERAKRLFTDAGVVTRKEALNKFRSVMKLTGDPVSGAEVYQVLCSSCHIRGDIGKEVGPNLTEIHRKSAETLIHDIIDPNAAVETAYINHLVSTSEGEQFSGIIIHETDQVIVIRNLGGEDQNINRKDIFKLESTGMSIMPEGFENSLDQQKMADLLAFLQQFD